MYAVCECTASHACTDCLQVKKRVGPTRSWGYWQAGTCSMFSMTGSMHACVIVMYKHESLRLLSFRPLQPACICAPHCPPAGFMPFLCGFTCAFHTLSPRITVADMHDCCCTQRATSSLVAAKPAAREQLPALVLTHSEFREMHVPVIVSSGSLGSESCSMGRMTQPQLNLGGSSAKTTVRSVCNLSITACTLSCDGAPEGLLLLQLMMTEYMRWKFCVGCRMQNQVRV